jgi:hypothetical protein
VGVGEKEIDVGCRRYGESVDCIGVGLVERFDSALGNVVFWFPSSFFLAIPFPINQELLDCMFASLA